MCLAVPLEIVKIKGEFAEVKIGKKRMSVNIQMLSDAKIGDYILVHAGFAIQRIDPVNAKKTLDLINEIH